MSFLASIELTLVDTVGLAAIDRREAVFGVAFAVTANGTGVTADGLTDFVISQAVISVQETPGTRENTRFVRSRGEQCVQFGSFIGRQIDNVLLSSWHDGLQNVSECY